MHIALGLCKPTVLAGETEFIKGIDRMKTQKNALLSAVAGLCALLAFPSDALAGNVGHYELCTGEGAAYLADAITANGHTPVNVTVPDATQLAGLSALLVTNCSNVSYSSEWTANLAAIDARVQGGMDLIFFDRYVTGAGAQLPGGSGLVAIRDVSNNTAVVDLPSNSPLLVANGGSLSQTSLDGGNSSTHGYVTAASLPAGAAIWAARTDLSQGVVVRYGRGTGTVIYSTIPGDYYLSGYGPLSVQTGVDLLVHDLFNNLVGFTTCAAEGYTSGKLLLCQRICEMKQSPSTLATLIKGWITAYKEDPPCL